MECKRDMVAGLWSGVGRRGAARDHDAHGAGRRRRRGPRAHAHPPARGLLQQPVLLAPRRARLALRARARARTAARRAARPLRHVAHALVRRRLEAASRQLGLLECDRPFSAPEHDCPYR